MTRPQSRGLTLEEAITHALAAGAEESAAALLCRAFGRDPVEDCAELPELLEELAEYYAMQDRSEEAIAAAGRAVLMTSDTAPEPDQVRCRSRIASILLRSGLPDEACAVWAAVADEVPGETWVHEAAGSEYLDAGEYDLSLAWVSAGLQMALDGDESDDCIRRLLGVRRLTMSVLALPADDLDRRADARLRGVDAHHAEADDIIVLDELDRDGVSPDPLIRVLHDLRDH